MAADLPLLARWRGELAGNRRLRLGLLAIGVMLLYLLFQSWSQHLERLRADARQAAREVRRLQLLPPLAHWQQRAAQADAALAEQKARIWVASSSGAAQAALQEHLSAALRGSPVTRVSISVAEPEPVKDAPTGGLVRLRATVSYEAAPGELWPALGGLLRRQPEVALDSLTFRRTPAPRIEVGLSAVALTDAAAAAGADRAATTPR